MLTLQVIACHLTIFFASYRHFGFWDALAVTGAVYMLMPDRQIFTRDATPR